MEDKITELCKVTSKAASIEHELDIEAIKLILHAIITFSDENMKDKILYKLNDLSEYANLNTFKKDSEKVLFNNILSRAKKIIRSE